MKTQETKIIVAQSLSSASSFSARLLKGESPLESLERKAKRLYGKNAQIFANHEVKGRFEVVTPCKTGGWNVGGLFYTSPENLA